MARTASQYFPGLRAAHDYQRSWIGADVLTGIALVALLVPQGMAYAELAGLPPVTGLYATAIGLLVYALLGPSRTLILGPDSALSPMVYAALLPLLASDASPGQRVALASMLTILMGLLCVAAGVLRVGVLADLLSMPMRVGFLNGIAFVVVVSQLPKLFGFSTDADGVLDQIRAFGQGVADGRVNTTSLIIGLGCLATIVILKVLSPRAPAILIAVVGASVIVLIFDLTNDGVAVVGTVPQGFPTPAWPNVTFGEARSLAVAAVAMSFITLADTVALSRTFAERGDAVDADQEITALGVANIATGLFQGFAVSASASRTALAKSTGARSQLAGVIAAAGILILLVTASNITERIPNPTLAAIVIAASFALFDARALVRLAQVRRSEFFLALATVAGVILFGVLEGIAIAAGLSIANFVRRAWRPYSAGLGRIDGRKGYHDVGRHPDARQIPGLVLFRFDAPLFFANIGYFSTRILDLISTRGEPVRRVIVAAEPISDIDTTAAESLDLLLDDLRGRGIQLVFAELKGPVKDRLERYGLSAKLGIEGFPPTLGAAISDYLEHSDVVWVDWQDG